MTNMIIGVLLLCVFIVSVILSCVLINEEKDIGFWRII
jgi:hypothetical protein